MSNLQKIDNELNNLAKNVNVSTDINGINIANVRPNNFNQLLGYGLLAVGIVAAVQWIQTIK